MKIQVIDWNFFNIYLTAMKNKWLKISKGDLEKLCTLDHGKWPKVAKAIVTAGLTCAQEIWPIEKMTTTTVNPAVAAYSRRPTSPLLSWVHAMIPHTQNIKMKVPTSSAKTCIYVNTTLTCTITKMSIVEESIKVLWSSSYEGWRHSNQTSSYICKIFPNV